MRRLVLFALAGLLLALGVPDSPAASAPGKVGEAGGLSARARDQDILVSRKVAGLNSNPDFAVSPRGDLLVAWSRDVLSDRGPGTEVWVALVKRKTSGKFRKKPRPVKLSTGPDFNFGARIAWIEAIQQFFVVWAQDGGSDNAKRILARAVDGKTGKPVGPVKALISDDRHNTTPAITATFAGGKQNITLVYVSAPNPFARHAARGDGDSSIKSAEVTTKLTAKKLKELLKLDDDADVRIKEILDVSSEGDSCTLVLYDIWEEKDGTSTVSPRLALVTPSGVDDSSIGLRTATALTPYPGREPGTVRVVVTGTTVEHPGADSHVGTRAFVVDCKNGDVSATSDGISDSEAEAFVRMNFFIPIPDDILDDLPRIEGSGYLASDQADGKVHKQVLDEELNLVGTPQVIFDHRGTMTNMIGGDITPDSSNRSKRLGKKPNSVLVWTKAVGDAFDEEIRAHFFYLKPIG